jgi:hypothetical protein
MFNINFYKTFDPVKKIKWQLLFLFITLLYLLPIFTFSYNFPVNNDDYYVILDFLIRFKSSGLFIEKLGLVFTQYNGHQVVFTKILALFDYLNFREVNFRHLIIIGNLGLPLLLFFVFKMLLKSSKQNAVLFVPIVIYTLNYNFWETSFCATASIQNLWVLTFAILSLYFLTLEQQTSDIFYALLFAFCATFVNESGIFFLIAGNTVLFSQNSFGKKIIIWNTFGAGLCIIYFLTCISTPDQSDILFTIINFKQEIIYSFFITLGSGIDIANNSFFLFAGQILFILNLNLIYKKYYKLNPIVASILLFMLLMIASFAIGMAKQGDNVILSPRYPIIPPLYMALIVYAYTELYFVTHQFSSYKMIFYSLISVSYVNFTYYTNKNNFELRHDKLEQHELMASIGSINEDFDYGWLDNDKTTPKQILSFAETLGIFHSEFSQNNNPLLLPNYENPSKVKAVVEFFEETNKNVVCYGWAIREKLSSEKTAIFFVIKDKFGNVVLIKPAIKTQRDYVQKTFFPSHYTSYLNSGFHIYIDKSQMPVASYKLEILLTDGKSKTKIQPSRTFKVLNKLK